MRRSSPHLARLAAGLAGIAATFALPCAVRADDPPCASLYPSAGPAGVDLQGACVANDLVENYTAATSSTPDMLWTVVLIMGAAWVAAVVAYSIWRFIAGRTGRKLAPVSPTAFWLCERCRSFNADDATVCYKCHLDRSEEAPVVDATGVPPWDQRFGRPYGS